MHMTKLIPLTTNKLPPALLADDFVTLTTNLLRLLSYVYIYKYACKFIVINIKWEGLLAVMNLV